jgi:RNA polymerase sigma factor (sigma-70 family)
MNDVGSFDLLEAKQERALGTLIQAGLRAERRLADAGRDAGEEALSESERRKLMREAHAGRRARDQLVQANLRLVVHIARKFPQFGLPLEDLIQEGNVGLLKAAERYDPTRGFRFSTFAVHWIRQTMRVALAKQGHWLGVPAKVRRQLAMLSAATSRLTGQLGRKPSDAELAQETGLSRERIALLQRWGRRALELDREIGESGGARLGDTISAPEEEQPARRADELLRRESVLRALERLPQTEATVLLLSFGLQGGNASSCAEVGRQLNLSESRVRQIRQKALRMLRHPSRRGGLPGLAS